ncbi:purine-nucleoside phosphorylase [Jiella mangrovi]|uniref:Purine nucleoside permease n=1 Tax=Jiella mangrovi TaxID=2821407 RepID=A0ABS4BI80_9HYPH|nr:purine nucleoside permease [Jiella mangrovi]MBP0616464.1 purine nucleoside permease [Jiella mangrovi]
MKTFAAAGLVTISLASSAFAQTSQEPFAPKVVVVTMFKHEAANWLKNETLDETTAIPGLSKEFPDLACSSEGLCLVTTSMGYANAASSIAALIYSDKLDLSKTYFLIAGIAGVDPADGTTGSAHWARYAVDGGLQWEIDARELPKDWKTGLFGFFTKAPGEKPSSTYGTEVYHLNEALTDKAFALSKDVELADDDTAKAYRANYAAAPATDAPIVSICDTVSGDTWWHGKSFSDAMNDWAKLLTDGKANYCTTQQEDNATLAAFSRGAEMGRIDMDRIAILRTASNFDQPYEGQTPDASLNAKSGGFTIALDNAYRVGSKLTDAIVGNWDDWKNGVPAN